MSAECYDCGADLVYAAGKWPLGECPRCTRDEEIKRLKGLLAAIVLEAESLNVDLAADLLTQKQTRVRVQNIHGLAVTPEVEALVTQNVTSVETEPDDPQNTGSKPDTNRKWWLLPHEGNQQF